MTAGTSLYSTARQLTELLVSCLVLSMPFRNIHGRGGMPFIIFITAIGNATEDLLPCSLLSNTNG